MSRNGPTTMYAMKPLFNLDNIHLQDNSGMYKIKSQNPTQTCETGKETVEEIEKRQECLLQKIAELKGILVSIKSLSKVPNPKIASKMAVTPDFSKLGLAHDIVLNVHPNFPLYSFLVLDKIWDWFKNVNYTWHTHSTLRSIPQSAKSFQDKIISSTQEPILNITFVWKNVSDCEFVLSPIKSIPMIGEVNFLRFLNRLVSPQQDIFVQSVQDGKLDAIHALQTSSDKEAQEYFDLIADGLDNDWIMGKNITIVDIAAWSAIKKMKKTNLKPKLASWYNRCDQFVNSA